MQIGVSVRRVRETLLELVPFRETLARRRARRAAARLRNRAKAMKLGKFDWEEWKKFRDEGRP